MTQGGSQLAKPTSWRVYVWWGVGAGLLPVLGLVCWLVVVPELSGRQRGKPTSSPQIEAAKMAAVAASLEKFYAGRWDLPDPVVFIEDGPYAGAAPRRLGGKDVELISRDALLKRYAGRDTAPCLTRINVYGVNDAPGVAFCVEISMSGISGPGYVFKCSLLGGARVYEFSLVSGRPVLGKTQIITF